MRPTPLVEVHVRSRRVRGSYAQQALKACREKLAHDCGPENRLALILEILIQDGDVGFFQSRLPESRHVSAGFPEHVAGAVRQPREELRGHEATGHRVVIDAADVEPHRDAHVARVGRASPCDLRVHDPRERNGLTFLGQGCGHPEGVCCREHALEARHVRAPGFEGYTSPSEIPGFAGFARLVTLTTRRWRVPSGWALCKSISTAMSEAPGHPCLVALDTTQSNRNSNSAQSSMSQASRIVVRTTAQPLRTVEAEAARLAASTCGQYSAPLSFRIIRRFPNHRIALRNRPCAWDNIGRERFTGCCRNDSIRWDASTTAFFTL
mmetsp:Transcript_6915/g.13125  ORF Transcript_6915/g.13125 Transcript_6915/m.13125 type:complete len:323 (-) Transcript_6915:791-1759(-)